VFCIGHGHPEVNVAITRQLDIAVKLARAVDAASSTA